MHVGQRRHPFGLHACRSGYVLRLGAYSSSTFPTNNPAQSSWTIAHGQWTSKGSCELQHSNTSAQVKQYKARWVMSWSAYKRLILLLSLHKVSIKQMNKIRNMHTKVAHSLLIFAQALERLCWPRLWLVRLACPSSTGKAGKLLVLFDILTN